MSYTKHHCNGIVLAGFDLGEADRGYHLFTREFGLIYAKAKGARKLSSKLRFSLQELSELEISFLRARDTWRVTGTSELNNFFKDLSVDRGRLGVAQRTLRLIRRLSGEEHSEALYDAVQHGLVYLRDEVKTKEDGDRLEVLLLLRILHHLGYLGSTNRFAYLLAAPYVHDMFLYEAGRDRKRAVQEINRALREMQL